MLSDCIVNLYYNLNYFNILYFSSAIEMLLTC